MKKLLGILALLMVACTLTFAQEKVAESTAKVAKAGPAISFEVTTIDYGTIEQGADPFRIFKFKNTGTEPLVITNARGSCGCTVPTYPKDPILPGDSGEIKVRYDTNRIGAFTKTVSLTTNASTEETTLMIKGEVKEKKAAPSGLPAKEGNPFNSSNN